MTECFVLILFVSSGCDVTYVHTCIEYNEFMLGYFQGDISGDYRRIVLGMTGSGY